MVFKRTKNSIIKKLKDKTGDSFVEAMCALTIIGIAGAFMIHSIVVAKKVNKIVSVLDVPFSYEYVDLSKTVDAKISVDDKDITTGEGIVSLKRVVYTFEKDSIFSDENSTYEYYTYETKQ